MIRPFQPFDTISTRRSAPDATGYIIRESLRTVPSSAVRLTADLGLYRCFMDAGGGKTGPGRLLSAGRSGRWSRMFRVVSDRPDPYFSTGIPRRTGSGCRYRTLARRVSPRPGARFSDTESPVRRSVSYLLSDTRYSRNSAAARERMPLPELLPGGVSPRPGARFSDTESRIRRSVSYLRSDTRYSWNSGIPRRHGSGCRYRNSCPARLAPARGTVFGYRISGTQVGIVFAVRHTLFPEFRGGTGADAATGTLARRRLSPARGTVFGYRYEKRCLFRFIRNISFPGSLRAARERMPLLKLLPGGVSPRPGTSGFFIPSPACRFSPARC